MISIRYLVLFVTFILCACGSEAERPESQLLGEEGTERRLTFHNWEEYIGSDTLEAFTAETGIQVDLITFDDDEEVIGAMQSGSFGGDLVVVSESLAHEMVKAKLLARLDTSLLPNREHIDPQFLHPNRSSNQYMIPYMIGTTGLAVNTKYVKNGADSWELLWDERYKGRIGMLNNPFEVIGSTSKLLGYGINPLSDAAIEDVRNKVLEQKNLVAGYYDPIQLREKMVDETLWVAQTYSGDAVMAMEENNGIRYVVPREGSVIWVDVFVIPRDASNKAEAHALINFIHRPRVIAEIVEQIWYATPNTGAREHIDPAILANEAVYPPQEILDRCDFFGDMGGARSVSRRLAIWAELMATR